MAAAAARFARSGGEAAVRTATTFIRAVRRLWMPRSQQQVVLDVVHELHGDGVFDSATSSGLTFTIPLAKKIDTVEEHAEVFDGRPRHKGAEGNAPAELPLGLGQHGETTQRITAKHEELLSHAEPKVTPKVRTPKDMQVALDR